MFCGAARNRVVCRQRERPSTAGHIHPKTLKETQKAIKTLIASTKPATEEVGRLFYLSDFVIIFA